MAAFAMIASCGGEKGDNGVAEPATPVLTAATLGEQDLMSATEYLALEPYASADRKKGAQQAQICRACHSLEKGGANMIGPNLHGFFGTAAGSVEGFAYSPVLSNAEFVWTPRAMDAWLAQPGQFLPGNRMTIAGVPAKENRDALIAYLLEETTGQ